MLPPAPFALRPDQVEACRKLGIDAYNRGRPRSANPFSYEMSQAWDSGWLQGQQAQGEGL